MKEKIVSLCYVEKRRPREGGREGGDEVRKD